MRSLHVNFSRSWGGLEKNSYDLAVNLHKAGHEILFACRKGYSIEKALRENNIPHISYDHIIAYADIPLILSLRRIIRDQNFKAVQVTHTEDLGLVVPAMMGLDAKLFLWLQMLVPGPKKDVYHRWEYRRISRIFCGSPVLGDTAVRHLPIVPEQIHYLGYALDTGIYRPERDAAYRRALGFADGDIVLGILGRLDPSKGQMEAVRAMPEVLRKHPNTRLLLVGDETVFKGKGEKERLAEEVARLGLGGAVTFVGDRRGAEQAKTLNSFDVFLSPSHFETCSTSMMMAELCAIPVIGTNAGGTPAQLGHGKYGTLVEPKDPSSLAHGIIEVLDAYSKAKEKALANLPGAITRYDSNSVREQVLAEYGTAPRRP